MSKPWPVLVTGYTPGFYAQMAALACPLWDEWALRHDYIFRPTRFPDVSRDRALRSKLPTIVSYLEEGVPVIWVDVDTIPVLDSPHPDDHMPEGIHIAAVVLPHGRPKTGHLLSGILYADPEALPIFRQAVALQGAKQLLYIDERALAAAVLGLDRIPDREPEPTSTYPVHRLELAWCRQDTTTFTPKSRAYLWHASTIRRERVPLMKHWISQGRHVHPAADPLPAAWRKPADLSGIRIGK